MVLLNEFNFARPPCLVEPGFQRGVEAKDEHEAFIRYRLYPVFLLTFGCFKVGSQEPRLIFLW